VKNINFQIIVPFFNDFENFKLFVHKINELEIDEKVFFLLDNGSEKNEMIEYSNNSSNKASWEVIKIEKNLGFGGGVIYGSKYVTKEFIGWMPGNMKLNPKDVFELFLQNSLKNPNQLLKGTRINRPFLDSFKTLIFGLIATLYFRINLLDAGGTPNLVHRSFFDIKSEMPTDVSFDVFAYYYFRKLGKVIRPAISYKTRVHGNSKWQKGLKSEVAMTLNILGRKKTWDKIIRERK